MKRIGGIVNQIEETLIAVLLGLMTLITFANVIARYVFNDITLDGNYFSNSHSVDLTNEQALVSAGFSWHNDEWGVVASIQDSTRTFEERKENTLFGSVSLNFRL